MEFVGLLASEALPHILVEMRIIMFFAQRFCVLRLFLSVAVWNFLSKTVSSMTLVQTQVLKRIAADLLNFPRHSQIVFGLVDDQRSGLSESFKIVVIQPTKNH